MVKDNEEIMYHMAITVATRHIDTGVVRQPSRKHYLRMWLRPKSIQREKKQQMRLELGKRRTDSWL